MSNRESVTVFEPREMHVRRREDGRYDLVALCDIPADRLGRTGQVTMILGNLTLVVSAWFEYGRASCYDISVASPLVRDERGVFMWQKILSASDG